MKRLIIGMFIHLSLAGTAWCLSPVEEMFQSYESLELQVKIVMSDRSNLSSTEIDEYTQEKVGFSEQQELFDLTVEGTYQYKRYELPDIPPIPGIPPIPIPTVPLYPRGTLLIEDTKDLTIAGTGSGSSSYWRMATDCKPPDNWPCQKFKQEGTQMWRYDTVNSIYNENLVKGLEVKQQSENAPVQYTFQLAPVGIHNYVAGSGSGTTTVRGYTTNETTSYVVERYGASLGLSWSEFTDEYTGRITGDLTVAGDRGTGSGHLTHSYDYTSADGDRETGTVEIFYRIKVKLANEPDPPDESELGCPDGKCKGSGGNTAPGAGYGAPVWNVNTANLNIFVTDTPLWYQSPIGPPLEVTLSYNSRSAAAQFEPVGLKWQLNYESYLTSDQATGDVTIFMPDGRRDLYTYSPTGFTPPYRGFNELKVTRQGGLFDGNDYDLSFPDGTVYVYKVPTWSYRWAFLHEIRDPHGNRLTLQWEGQFPFGGLLKQITDATGRRTTFTQDQFNRITTISDPFGRHAYFEYDPLGRLTKITDMGGYATTFDYETDGTIRRMAQGSNTWDFLPDAASLTVTNNLGVEKFVLGGQQGSASYQGANGGVDTTYAYTIAPAQDGSKLRDITGLQTPEGVGFDFTFDPKGNILTDTLRSATGNATLRFAYNSKGKVISFTDARGEGTQLTYAANGVDLTELKDGLGTIRATYNDTHDVASLTDRLGNTKSFVYNAFGQVVQTTDPLNVTTDFLYNDAHQLIGIDRAGTAIARFGYDTMGRVNAATDAANVTTTYTYNHLDDPLTVTYPDGTFTQYTYSTTVPHLRETMTDQAGRITHYTYNGHKQVEEVLDPAGGTIRFGYYPAGNVKELTDQNGNLTRFEYDKDGRLVKKLNADGSSVRFTYTNGRLTRFTNARGVTTDYTHDTNGNVLTITYSDGTPGLAISYDAANRPIEIQDGLGTHRRTYDAASRLTTSDGPWNNDTLTFGYDALGRNTSVALEQGPQVTYDYDDLGRLTAVTSDGLTYAYQYLGGATLLETLTRPDGSRTEYTYDATMKRLQRFTNRERAGGVLNEHTFTFDTLGQPVHETVTNSPVLQSGNVGAAVFTFNNLNQAVTLDGADTFFAYDPDGNMIKGLTGDGRPFDATYDAENRLTSIQYTDGAGIRRRQEYRYGGDGFLGIQSHFADGVKSGEQRFIRSGGKVLQERDADNNIVRDYLWDSAQLGGVGTLLALVQGGAKYQYLSNPRGDITAVLDSTGAVAAAYAYDPFGMPLATVGTLKQPMRFASKAYDEGTGLSYYGYRFHAPALGRWITRDPIGERGGINLYGFVQNNPLMHVDPLGLDWEFAEPFKNTAEMLEYYRNRPLDPDGMAWERYMQSCAQQMSKISIADTFRKIEDTVVKNAPAASAAASAALAKASAAAANAAAAAATAAEALGTVLSRVGGLFIFAPQIPRSVPGGPTS